MTPSEADDIISELSTAELARRYGFSNAPRQYGPPSYMRAKRDGEAKAVVQGAEAQIERAFGKSSDPVRRAA